MAASFKYHLRPEYGSENLLIEIFQGIKADEVSEFISVITRVLTQINPSITDIIDLWMNDETMFCFKSNEGEFNISVAVWNLGFITSHNNQKAIKAIDLIFQNSAQFEKIDVDFNDYKLDRKL